MKLFGKDTDVTDVDIVETSGNLVAEYKLSDGSLIKFGVIPAQVVRLDGQWNNEGNPVYLVLNGTTTLVLSSPDTLRRAHS